MSKQDVTKEQLQSEVMKANAIIQKLQNTIGALQGKVAYIEVERDSLLHYVQSAESEKEKDKGKPITKPKK